MSVTACGRSDNQWDTLKKVFLRCSPGMFTLFIRSVWGFNVSSAGGEQSRLCVVLWAKLRIE